MNCTCRNTLSTHNGLARTKLQDTIRISSKARKKPVAGDSTMAEAVLLKPDHTITDQPPLHRPAPTGPPISEGEEEEGMPAAQGTMVPMVAPTRAPTITGSSMMPA